MCTYMHACVPVYKTLAGFKSPWGIPMACSVRNPLATCQQDKSTTFRLFLVEYNDQVFPVRNDNYRLQLSIPQHVREYNVGYIPVRSQNACTVKIWWVLKVNVPIA